MKITRKDQKNSIVELTVIFDKAEFAKAEETALRKIATTVKVDGFRKGHIPEAVVRQKVGEGAIKQEAIDLAISQGYMEALQKEKLHPLVQPEVSIEKMDPLEFKISVQVYPEVKLGKIDTSKVKIVASKVTKKEIDEQVKMICNQSAEKSPVTRKAKKGDIAVIDFDGKNADGETQPGMKSAGHPLELGTGAFIPGFEEEVIGMKKGEEKTFPITFPKDYQSTDIAGKEFFFTVTVQDVLEKKLPKFDDAFAAKITGEEGKKSKDLLEEIKGHLKKNKDDAKYAAAQKDLFELIGKGTTAELPPIFIEEEVKGMMDNMKMQGLQQGMPWEKYLEMMKKTEEELAKEMKKDAEKAVLSRLGLQAMIKEDDSIVVSDAEIEEEVAMELAKIESQAAERNAKPEELESKKSSFQKGNDGWAQVENRLNIRKFFDKYLGKKV